MQKSLYEAYDYVVGGWLVAVPWIFKATSPEEYWIPVLTGLGIIVYGLFSNHSLAFVRLIPQEIHIIVDAATAIFIALIPWLFDFSPQFDWPLIITGITDILIVLLVNWRVKKINSEKTKGYGHYKKFT
jgi:hypothetical protein